MSEIAITITSAKPKFTSHFQIGRWCSYTQKYIQVFLMFTIASLF
jgi:hypothetical protein